MSATRIAGQMPFERFMAYRRFSAGLAFSVDGEHLYFVSNISDQFNLWRVGAHGGWPTQLTPFTADTVRLLAVSPVDGTVVFCADHDGDEFHQLYRLDAEGGWPERITDAPEAQHFVGPDGFSPDGTKLAYASNARTPTDMEVWVRDLETGDTRPVFGEGTYSSPAAWSPDGSKLLVSEVRSNSDTSIHLLELDTGQSRELTNRNEKALRIPGPWTADGSGFYFLSDEGREFKGLALYDLTLDRADWILTPDNDIDELAGSRDGRMLARLVNEDGYERVRFLDTEAGRDLPEPDLPAGARQHLTGLLPPIALSPDGSQAAIVLAGPASVSEAYVVDTATGSARSVTESWTAGGFAGDALTPAELISFPSFDGRDIPAWLYRPTGAAEPMPVVVSIHGGPEVQERPIYNPLYQYLASRGVAVLAPNIRGSTGYGKTYQRLIHRDWGGGDLKDWEHAALWLRAQDWVDPERLGVFGGSYGGFAVLSCVTRLPAYWAAAVDVFGPSNLLTFARAVPPSWRRMMKDFVGDPDEDEAMLLERSPLTYVENTRAPLLVVQGAKDPRVVKAESDQLVERLRSLGRTVEYLVFEDEGHGFTRRENELKTFRAAAEWFERYLLAER